MSAALKNIDSESSILPNTFDKHDKGKQKEFLQDVFDSLNIPYEVQAIQRLLSKKSDINRIKKSLKSIAEYGLNLTSKELKGEIPITYEDLLQKKRKGAENVEEQGVLSKEINNILTILANYQENLQLENKARYNDTNYMSDVLPSFMTNLIEDIKSFGEDEDIKQLLAKHLLYRYGEKHDAVLPYGRPTRSLNEMLKDTNSVPEQIYKSFRSSYFEGDMYQCMVLYGGENVNVIAGQSRPGETQVLLY